MAEGTPFRENQTAAARVIVVTPMQLQKGTTTEQPKG